MQVLLKLNNGELQLMTEENFETIHELKGISSYTILGWLHDKKPICNMCNDYLDDDSRPVGAQVSHVCGEQELKKKILNKFIDRITYYEKQKLMLPRSEKLKSRIRELKYMMKEIDNIFFENDSRKSG